MASTFDIASQSNTGVAATNATEPSISGDGSLVAFQATDPVTMLAQAYVKNETTSALTLVSTSSSGATSNGYVYYPSISSDGSTVGFDTFATNLVANVTTAIDEVYVKNLATGGLTLVSQTAAGVAANAGSENAALSANGTIVAFDSAATNFGLMAPAGVYEIYVKNLSTGTLTLVSQTSTGTIANASSVPNDISADGNIVTFESSATDLGSTSGNEEIYSKNIQTGALQIVSQTAAGVIANASSYSASSSTDGNTVAFESAATNLVSGATSGNYGIYLKNLTTGALTLVSSSSAGIIGNGSSYNPIVSGDGRYVMFESTATNLVPNATNGVQQVYVKDLVTGQLTLLSQDASGTAGTSASYTGFYSEAGFSTDDTEATFYTTAANLGATAGNSTVLRATTAAPTLTLNPIAGDNVIDGNEAAAPVAISGTSNALGQTVTVSLDTAATVLGTATVQNDGSWSLSVAPGTISQGAHTAIATVPGSGYLSATATEAFTENLQPIVAFDDNAGFVNGITPRLTGTVQSFSGSASVEIFNGTQDLGAAAVASDGTWTFSRTLGAGEFDDLRAVATDSSGATGSADALYDILTGVQGQAYKAIEYDTGKYGGYGYITYGRNGQPLVYAQALDNDTHVIYALANNQTLYSLHDDVMTGAGLSQTFTFLPNFGHAEVTDFLVRGQGHDTLDLTNTTISSLGQLLRNTTVSGGNAEIHVNSQESITLDGVTKAQLANNRNDFRFA